MVLTKIRAAFGTFEAQLRPRRSFRKEGLLVAVSTSLRPPDPAIATD
jgi:hypothetical protein